MKKAVLTIIIICCMRLLLFPQNEFGILAGGGISTIHMREYLDYKSRHATLTNITLHPNSAYQAGFFFNHTFTPKWGAGIDMLIKAMGANYATEYSQQEGGGASGSGDDMYYFSVPFYVKYHPRNEFFLAAGIANNLLVFVYPGKDYLLYNGDIVLRKYDLMAQLSMGGKLTNRLVIECTFNHSITNIDKKNTLSPVTSSDRGRLYNLYNQAIYITLRYSVLVR